MKNRSERTPGAATQRASAARSAALVAAFLLSALAWPGCSGSVSQPGTGETHFLGSCDAGCGGGLSCMCGVCTKSCDGNAACSVFGARSACLLDTTCSGNVCGIECAQDQDCRALGAAYTCENSRCREGREVVPDGGAVADSGNDFSTCERPPPSSCTLADTCAHLDCGGLEFDEKGCRRATCTTDAECGTDDRCTRHTCVDTTTCNSNPSGSCTCATTFDCRAASLCNPVTVVGPRGDWMRLEVERASGPCPPGVTCTTWWRIGPDGGLAASKAGEPISSRINDGDLAELAAMVNGPELRAALRDGIPCELPPTDIGITIRLELSTETLEREVTGCVLSGPSGNVFQRIDQIAERY